MEIVCQPVFHGGGFQTLVYIRNHLEGLLRQIARPISRVSAPVGLKWRQKSALLISSQVMLLLLARAPQFENQCTPRDTDGTKKMRGDAEESRFRRSIKAGETGKGIF